MGGLTPEEIITLQSSWGKYQETTLAQWEAITKGMSAVGIDFGDQTNSGSKSGLQADIMRMKEETGGELAGITRATHDELKRHGETLIESNRQIIMITDYSRRTAEATEATVGKLGEAIVELKSIVTNTKPVYTGSL